MTGDPFPQSPRPGRVIKAAQLARLAAMNPVELYDRVRARVEVKRSRFSPATPYEEVGWDDFICRIGRTTGGETRLAAYSDEFDTVYECVTERAQAVGESPFSPLFDADPTLARLAYVFARLLEPEVVVETGVALGVASSCILAALDRNGGGRLVSIDLPPLGVSPEWIGRVIPHELRGRWTLIRGSSTRVLPGVLCRLPPVGLFVHDSLFTWRNSTAEYSQILPALAERAAIVANCVHQSAAFSWLANLSCPTAQAVLRGVHKTTERIGASLYWQQ
jgi:hypothetical protein